MVRIWMPVKKKQKTGNVVTVTDKTGSYRRGRMASTCRIKEPATLVIASDPFKDDLLAEVQVGYGEDYRLAVGESAGQEREVVAGGMVVIIEGVHDALLIGQAADILFEAFDDFRSGEQGLPGKSHDLLFIFRAPVSSEELSGGGEGRMVTQGKFQEGACPLQHGTLGRQDIQVCKQVVECIVFCFPGAADDQAAHQEALDACQIGRAHV